MLGSFQESGNDAVFFEFDDVVPLISEINQHLLGVLGMLRATSDDRWMFVELDSSGGEAEVARLVLDLGDVAIGEHLWIFENLGNPGVGRPREPRTQEGGS